MSQAVENLDTETAAPLEECLSEGTVRAVDAESVFVTLPGGHEGVAPIAEWRGAPPAVGDAVCLFVDAQESGSGRFRLSKEKTDRLVIWSRIEEAAEKSLTIEGEIVAPMEGGYSVDIGMKAFLPGSQLDSAPVRDVSRFMGRKLPFRIIRFHKARANIVLSRRVLLEEERKATIERLTPGAVLEGTVQSLTDYGAFVDVGGVVGLLHVTDMSWGRVLDPSEFVEEGQRVKVKVLKWDPEKQRLSLGIRQLQEDPWLDADRRYAPGTVVRGTVVSVTDFGLFLALEPGVEGLIHTTGSVPGADRARELAKKGALGQELAGVVLELDVAKKRISLGLKVD